MKKIIYNIIVTLFSFQALFTPCIHGGKNYRQYCNHFSKKISKQKRQKNIYNIKKYKNKTSPCKKNKLKPKKNTINTINNYNFKLPKKLFKTILLASLFSRAYSLDDFEIEACEILKDYLSNSENIFINGDISVEIPDSCFEPYNSNTEISSISAAVATSIMLTAAFLIPVCVTGIWTCYKHQKNKKIKQTNNKKTKAIINPDTNIEIETDFETSFESSISTSESETDNQTEITTSDESSNLITKSESDDSYTDDTTDSNDEYEYGANGANSEIDSETENSYSSTSDTETD